MYQKSQLLTLSFPTQMEYLPLLSTSVLPSRPAVTSNSPLSLFQISDQDTVPSVSGGEEGGGRYLAIPGTWAMGNFHQFTSFIVCVSCTSEYLDPSIELIPAMCLCKQDSHEATCHNTRIVDLLYSLRNPGSIAQQSEPYSTRTAIFKLTRSEGKI
jgi:hypothetical protein